MNGPAVGDAPVPELVAARSVIGVLDESLVPTWAAWWIVEGHDGPGVVDLAGLSGDDPFEVRDALRPALIELGVSEPSFAQAWRTVATDWAAACLDDRLDEFELALGVERVYVASGYEPDVLTEPLGAAYDVDDARSAGFASDAYLRSRVRSACLNQVELGRTPKAAAFRNRWFRVPGRRTPKR